ncbi:hypothetical protein FRC02_011594 [Tulasnella sp. 418]|nr:hypothetical protein FRC02_011594 [Tulasnella sp. 418]
MSQLVVSSLTDVVALSQSSQPPQAIANLLKSFSKRDVGETILASFSATGEDPLSVLDPHLHTLGFLYILSSRLNVPSPQVTAEQVNAFCSTFTPETARLAPERVTLLAKGIIYVTELNRHPELAIPPLSDLISRYPTSPSHLTTLHPIFLRACVRAQLYEQALPLLKNPITDVDRSISDLAYTDNLVYHYLGGVILGSLKLYKESEEFFEIAASSPGQVASAVQLEAYKKLSLIQLLLYGKTKNLPKYANQALTRLLKYSPYQTFIKNYPSTTAALYSILDKDAETFHVDGNVGLMKRVIQHSPRWMIRKLTDTYLTLSLEDISVKIANDVKTATSPQAIEEINALILSMIDNQEIHATISPSTTGQLGATTVTFQDSPPPLYFNPSVLEKILIKAQQESLLLEQANKALGKSKEYLTKAIKDKEHVHYDETEQFAVESMGRGGRGVEWDD